jgi:hypothetical protein
MINIISVQDVNFRYFKSDKKTRNILLLTEFNVKSDESDY